MLSPCALLTVSLVLAADASPVVRFAADGAVVTVSGVSAADRDALSKWDKPESWTPLFIVFLDKAEAKERAPLLGTYRLDKETIVFEPRFPLARGIRYRAVFDPSRLPSAPKGAKAIEATLLLEKPKTPPTVVEQVYPTADKLPENQLKFYLHFSAPMSRGEVYEHVRLLKNDGKEVVSPFLELGEELWDREQKRFTLFIDPGRIKRGLKPREDLGPVLEEGKTYTLEIDRRWRDAEGVELKETYRKTFKVGPPVEKQLDVKTWKVQAPAAGDRGQLIVTLPIPHDHALLHRMIWVADAKGRRIAGTVQTTDQETRWRFKPEKAWEAGAYQIVADVQLEDLAGNNLARAFEVDVFHPVERTIKTETVTLPFEVRKN
jgi:hypothetical protein